MVRRSEISFAVISLTFVCLAFPAIAEAGMPGITLSNVGRLRLNAISFFLVVFFVVAWVIRAVWNYLGHDFAFLPRISYGKAIAAVFLWGVLFILVLTMISGARELMTPGAWEKQGWTYKLASERDREKPPVADSGLLPRRRSHIEQLQTALFAYATAHEGHFPESQVESRIPAELWCVPEKLGIEYVYLAGRSSDEREAILAFEPNVYGDSPFVIYAGGRLTQMRPNALRAALESESKR